jgi:hypothetical protein
MPGKYTPLEVYLRDLPSTQKEVTLSFAQIEKILKSKLPASAYEDNRWWEHVPLCPVGHLPQMPKSTEFGGGECSVGMKTLIYSHIEIDSPPFSSRCFFGTQMGEAGGGQCREQ